MHMAVDQAGHHRPPAKVDCPLRQGVARPMGSYRHDSVTRYADVVAAVTKGGTVKQGGVT